MRTCRNLAMVSWIAGWRRIGVASGSMRIGTYSGEVAPPAARPMLEMTLTPSSSRGQPMPVSWTTSALGSASICREASTRVRPGAKPSTSSSCTVSRMNRAVTAAMASRTSASCAERVATTSADCRP